MIISLVSRYNGAGKSYLSNILSEKFGFKKISFVGNITEFAMSLLNYPDSKYDVNEELGITAKDINHSISNVLANMHPELPVWKAKCDIIEALADGYNVVIDDARRMSEFVWLDKIAKKYGREYLIVEIVPVGNTCDNARLDMWTNGNEPCGYDAWHDMRHITVENDGTSLFDETIVEAVMERNTLSLTA